MCTQCHDGYEYHQDINQCVEESSNVVIFVIIGVAVVVLAVGGFFLWRFLKNRKQGRSLLES
jgi:cytochrome b subunit of formate dehydrogenase